MTRNSLRIGALLVSLAAAAPAAAQVEVTEATVMQLQDWMESGRATSAEITAAYLARIRAYDQAGPRLNAMIRLNPHALAEAEALDRERALRGPRGPLHGIPVILKDNFDLQGMPTTAGSLGLAGLMPLEDAFQVRKLREAGAVFLGKANLHELATGLSTIASLGGQTLNPYDLARHPGGSSGGTGAAVAASFAALGWGTDTCGSIRIPASHNNLVGLRPTHGLSSIRGILPLTRSQDTGGPLARTVRDLAIGLDATVGPDPRDPATAALEGRSLPSFVQALDAQALRGARLGIVRALFGGPGEQDGAPLVHAALARMVEMGADTVTVTIPGLDTLLLPSSRIAYEMRADILAYLQGIPGAPAASMGELLAQGVVHESMAARLRARDATPLDSAAHAAAVAAGEALRAAVTAAMDSARVDALVYPSMTVQPTLNPELQRGSTCQISAHSGLPSLSVPAGFTPQGLPMGVDFLGRAFDDARMVALGYAFEQGTGWRRAPATTPPLVDGEAPPPIHWRVTADGKGGERMEARLTFDPAASTLTYEVAITGVAPDEAHAVAIRRRDAEGLRYVVLRIAGPGTLLAAGTERLTPNLRRWLEEGVLTLELFTRGHPFGSAGAELVLPG